MSTITFNVGLFVERFPAFSDGVKYPTTTLDMYWLTASFFISPEDYGYLSGAVREQALFLMTAHIAQLATQNAEQDTIGILTGATIDKVTVSLQPPPVKSQLEYWLNLTPYGVQLWALLNTLAVGGFYIGGQPNYSAYRKANGGF
jgi:Protein of unknown function (DUF4054)